MSRIAALIVVAFVARAQQADQAEEFKKFIATIHTAMNLKAGSVVADVGSGDSPDHPVHISQAIGPTGKLVCEDIDRPALEKLAAKLKAEGALNVDFIVGALDDPKLPAHTFDAIMISNAYHEFTKSSAMLSHIREALKPNGRLVVIEAISHNGREKTRDEQVKVHELAPENLRGELETAGFRQLEMIVLRDAEQTIRYLISAKPD
jgi:ubiquinone/menaquinone biosynthesis C-methylase UbiE